MEIDFGILEPGHRKNTRREHDAYMTPAALAEAIVAKVASLVASFAPLGNTERIVEPACGDGEFVAALRKTYPAASIVAVDIRPELREKIEGLGAKFVHHDFLTIPPHLLADADLFIGNPPYSLHTEFIGHALDGMHEGATLALLLRFNMLVGAIETQAWWTAPRELGNTSPLRQLVVTLPIHPRPSFTGSGTDATEYMLAIWRKGFDNGGRYDPVKWDKPAPRRGRKPKVTP